MPGRRRQPPVESPTIEQWLLRRLTPAEPDDAAPLSAAALHAALRTLRGALLPDDPLFARAVRNHERAVLRIDPDHRPLRLFLLRTRGAHLAFAAAGPFGGAMATTYDFLDVPALHAVLAPSHPILTRAQLEAPFDPHDPRLREAVDRRSLADLAYWSPRRVGDVLFNFWD